MQHSSLDNLIVGHRSEIMRLLSCDAMQYAWPYKKDMVTLQKGT